MSDKKDAGPRFEIRPDALVDTKGKGRYAPIPGVTQDLADECNASPDRFEHFVFVPGLPAGVTRMIPTTEVERMQRTRGAGDDRR